MKYSMFHLVVRQSGVLEQLLLWPRFSHADKLYVGVILVTK